MSEELKKTDKHPATSSPVEPDYMAERLYDAIMFVKNRSFSQYTMEQNFEKIENDAKIYFENYNNMRRLGFGFAERHAFIEMFKYILEQA